VTLAVVTSYTVPVGLMDALQITILTLVAAGATVVVLIRERVRQVLTLSVYGVLLAVLIVITSSVGVLVMRDPYQKLHFVTPAALVAPALVALAVLVRMGLYENTGETCVALVFMGIAGPFLSHATVRRYP
jgi:multisubunit Na+/H+ antiporter MnhG subunit